MNKLPLKRQGPRQLVYRVFFVIWAIKLLIGLVDVAERYVPVYPDAVKASPYIGQFEGYVAIPVAFVIFNLLMLVFANKSPRWLDFSFAILQLIALMILLFLGSGGV